MRKFAVLFFCALAVSLYAGDVANFVNLGFSSDGSRYAFGQYGVTDGNFRSFADIYCVDVAKNSFLKGGVFSTAPSAGTANRDGKGVFAELQNTAASFLKKSGINSAETGRALYVLAEDGEALKSISFRDFETGAAYSVTLNTYAEGEGSKVSSSFYLIVEVKSAAGKTVRKTVGLPGFKRDGVKDYVVRRIVSDASGSSLVFVIEKKVVESKGASTRFMVETVRL